MSDTTSTIDRRSRDGTRDDAKPSTANATAYGALLGMVTGAADWLILNCYAGGHWHYVAPSQQLIEVAAPIILLPVALWLGQFFSIIGDIIMHKLRKADS